MKYAMLILFASSALAAEYKPPRAYVPPKAITAAPSSESLRSPLVAGEDSGGFDKDTARRYIYKVDLSGIDASKPFYVREGLWHRREPNEVLRPGNHWHECRACRLVMQHGPENHGDANAHRCPSCNRLIWEKTATPVVLRPIQSFQDCPT